MSNSRMREFNDTPARAIVLDDEQSLLVMAAEVLKAAGFEVLTCSTVDEFKGIWEPGMFDVIIADWDLAADERGDHVLMNVRERDWDVPFVLISGRVDEDQEKTCVLENLLESGGARFVERGEDGFERMCEEAKSLLERRDLVLLRVILKYRIAALENKSIQTSSGPLPVKKLLAEIVKNPLVSEDSSGPIAELIAAKLAGK